VSELLRTQQTVHISDTLRQWQYDEQSCNIKEVYFVFNGFDDWTEESKGQL